MNAAAASGIKKAFAGEIAQCFTQSRNRLLDPVFIDRC
jgi:hypothetical protein